MNNSEYRSSDLSGKNFICLLERDKDKLHSLVELQLVFLATLNLNTQIGAEGFQPESVWVFLIPVL